MVIINSIKQLMRTPLKTLFFFVMLVLTITFFMLGFNLWSDANENMRRLESTFVTIGTVEQKATSMATAETWDAEIKKYTYRTFPVTGDIIPLSALDFEGANYISKPEKRPFYCAYDPGYVVLNDPLYEAQIEETTIIVEMQPLEDCETGDPVPVKITKVLMGYPTLLDTTVMFCNHYEQKTYKLYAGKTYIVGLNSRTAHEGNEWFSEYTPWGLMTTFDSETPVPWDEVTYGFYETPKGRAWLNFVSMNKESVRHAIPVIPTNFTKLLMPFFDGDARITEGRDISDDEYKNGGNVCLVQKGFAEKNGLSVGGSLPLPLLYANYGYPSSLAFYPGGESGTMGNVLNENGEPYTPFDSDTYKIVGIYDVAAAYGYSPYTLGENAVVIPSASVKNSDESNTVNMGPMQGFSTSFRIPNGTIDKFMAAWKARGVDDLEIMFYDKGYSKIKAGLDEMKNMAILMLTVGAVTTLFTVILFCHLFITKQRRRTAIERSLGLSKARCTLSLLAGIFVIIIPAYIFGGLASHYLTGLAASRMNMAQAEVAYDTTFSDWVNGDDGDVAASVTISMEANDEGIYVAGAAVIPAALLIAFAAIRGNLKEAPLKLLSEKER